MSKVIISKDIVSEDGQVLLRRIGKLKEKIRGLEYSVKSCQQKARNAAASGNKAEARELRARRAEHKEELRNLEEERLRLERELRSDYLVIEVGQPLVESPVIEEL